MRFSNGIILGVLLILTPIMESAEAYNISSFDVNTQLESEQLMEYVLTQLSNRTISVPSFYVKIKKKLLFGFIMTHRNIDAWFNKGQLAGIDTIKVKNCQNPVVDGGDVTVSCRLDLNGVVVSYEAVVTGFSIFGGARNAVIKVNFRGTLYDIEIAKFDQESPTITTLVLNSFQSAVLAPDFGFNNKRNFRFREQIEMEARNRVIDIISNTVLPDLNKILRGLADGN